MPNAPTKTFRDLSENNAELVNTIQQQGRVIATNGGTEEYVVMSTEDYAGYEERLQRLFIFERLQKSKAKLADPNVRLIDATDVFAKINKKLEEQGL